MHALNFMAVEAYLFQRALHTSALAVPEGRLLILLRIQSDCDVIQMKNNYSHLGNLFTPSSHTKFMCFIAVK